MKKTIYTLNVGGYSSEITALTYPLLEYYARKIEAEFYVIDTAGFPGWPITYEKLQIFELSKKREDDWIIYIDSDAVVHPETIDWTYFLPRDTVAHYGSDHAAVRWRYDEYFARDGRHISSCNWNAVASSWCRDLWRPLELGPAEAVGNIFPLVVEVGRNCRAEHLVDDYALSRNIAKFGLKFVTLMDLQKRSGLPEAGFYWHDYRLSTDEKVVAIKDVIKRMELEKWVYLPCS